MLTQREEMARLRAELAAERETSRKWATLHAQLLPLCQRALDPAAAAAGGYPITEQTFA